MGVQPAQPGHRLGGGARPDTPTAPVKPSAGKAGTSSGAMRFHGGTSSGTKLVAERGGEPVPPRRQVAGSSRSRSAAAAQLDLLGRRHRMVGVSDAMLKDGRMSRHLARVRAQASLQPIGHHRQTPMGAAARAASSEQRSPAAGGPGRHRRRATRSARVPAPQRGRHAAAAQASPNRSAHQRRHDLRRSRGAVERPIGRRRDVAAPAIRSIAAARFAGRRGRARRSARRRPAPPDGWRAAAARPRRRRRTAPAPSALRPPAPRPPCCSRPGRRTPRTGPSGPRGRPDSARARSLPAARPRGRPARRPAGSARRPAARAARAKRVSGPCGEGRAQQPLADRTAAGADQHGRRLLGERRGHGHAGLHEARVRRRGRPARPRAETRPRTGSAARRHGPARGRSARGRSSTIQP